MSENQAGVPHFVPNGVIWQMKAAFACQQNDGKCSKQDGFGRCKLLISAGWREQKLLILASQSSRHSM
jgi:hypothetical protein